MTIRTKHDEELGVTFSLTSKTKHDPTGWFYFVTRDDGKPGEWWLKNSVLSMFGMIV